MHFSVTGMAATWLLTALAFGYVANRAVAISRRD
jgi:hypothetical protein